MVGGSVCGLYRPIVSMNRPSRGERRSATTTRHWGSFFPPTRVSRMLTAITARQDSNGGRPPRRVVGTARRRVACGATRRKGGARAAPAQGPRRGPGTAALAAPHDLPEIRHLALLDPAHHLAHLVELLDELV